MKSILIIGLGRFGRHLCCKFMSLKNEVMIVDRDEAAVTALADEATSAQIADCTDENALRALGVKNFDLCFVCIGSDFASSLLITSMLKDMGAARVVAKASQDIHAKLLLRNGADDVVYPERDSAERMATRLFPVTKYYLHHEMNRGTEKAGIKRIRIHDLRHSHVSLLIDMGFSAIAIADRMGHESIDITLNYAHLFPSRQSEMADRLEKERKGDVSCLEK